MGSGFFKFILPRTTII